MADTPSVREFTGGKSTTFRNHLNELVDPVNQLLREFNERARLALYDPAINACHILITAAEGIGHYTATALQYPSLGITASAAITAAELGGTDGEQVLAILPSELGASANTLTIPTGGLYAFAHLTGLGTNDNRRVLTIIGIAGQGNLTSPKVLTGSGGTAATDSWSLDTDKKAVTVEIETRDFQDTTAHVLSHFKRLFTGDSAGRLRSISVETKYTTDTEESCSATAVAPAFGF